MLGRSSLVFATVALLAACSSDPGGSPDAGGDGDGDGDGGELTAGLSLRLEPDPGFGDFEGDFDPTLDTVEIVLADLRAIGDAAPGDERTTLETLTLDFSDGEDVRVAFPQAPVGRYSRVRARVERYLTRGTLDIDSESLTWEIEVEPAGGIEIDLSLSPTIDVAAGSNAELQLEVRLDRAYDDVDWDDLTEVDDVLRVDDSFIEADAIYEKISELFEQ